MSARLAALAGLFTLAVCLVSWPGFMSYDSMYALRQARSGIETGGYPPMVSYIWALCERIVPGQGGMFVLQNALVFLGVAALGSALGAGTTRTVIAMILVACAPATLGPMLVVWKDVAFAGLMAIAYALTLRYVDRPRGGTLAAALSLLALASSFRLNGIAAAVPALAAIAWTLCSEATDSNGADGRGVWRRRFTVLATFALLTIATFGFVISTATWRLPDFKRIQMATGSGATQVHDLLGISVCTGRNLMPPGLYSGEMTPERLESLYRPEHSQLAIGTPPLLEDTALAANAAVVEASSLEARARYPLCYLWHRAHVFAYTMGANDGRVFYLTEPSVFPGEEGTEVTPSALTRRVVGYLWNYGASPAARGVLFALLAVGALALASRGSGRSRSRKAMLPMAGACTYLIGSFFVLPAADARYNFWANLVFMVTLCGLLPGLPVKGLLPGR